MYCKWRTKNYPDNDLFDLDEAEEIWQAASAQYAELAKNIEGLRLSILPALMILKERGYGDMASAIYSQLEKL